MLKVAVMFLILVGMVLVLVGLKHYLNRTLRHSEMNDADNERFRRSISSDDTVISRYSLFRRFFAEDDADTTPTIPRFFGGEGRGSRPHDRRLETVRNRRRAE